MDVDALTRAMRLTIHYQLATYIIIRRVARLPQTVATPFAPKRGTPPLSAESAQPGPVRAVPRWLAARVGGEIRFAEALIATVSVASVAIVALNIYSVAAGLGVASDGSVDDGFGPDGSDLI